MQTTKEYVFTFFFILCVIHSNKAQEISLRPVFSLQSGFHYLEHNQQSHPNFSSKNSLNMGGGLGLLVDYKYKNKHIFSIGMITGWHSLGGYEFSQPNIVLAAESGNYIRRIPILYAYQFQKFKFLKIGKNDKAIFVGNLQLQGGLQLGFAEQIRYSETINLPVIIERPLDVKSEQVEIRQNMNLSLRLGIGIQFQHKGEDKLKLAIYYMQGLGDLSKTQINYTVEEQNGSESEHTDSFISRGSALALELSYPIRIWRKK